MIKKLLALLAMLFALSAFAAPVDANKATQAELEGVKGIGPAIATKILDERKKGSFKDWSDMIERVKGVGDKNAAKFSSEGLTVNGASFNGAAPVAKKEDKPAKADATKAAPATTATTAAAAPAAAAASTPMTAAEKKAAAKKEKEDKKAAKAAAAEQAKQDKAAKKAAKAQPASGKASDAASTTKK